MSNFGFTQLRLVKPYDVAFREARSAVRSHYILEAAQVYESIAEAVADAQLVAGTTAVGHRDLHVPLYRLETAAQMLHQQAAASQIALLFGSEKFGLSNEQMSHCHWLLRIPTRDEHGSMNLGQAVAICLYELRRSRVAAETVPYDSMPPIMGENRERLMALLLESLQLSGYIQERTAVSAELKLRRLLLRSAIPAADSEAWLGIVRQIVWKLKQRDP